MEELLVSLSNVSAAHNNGMKGILHLWKKSITESRTLSSLFHYSTWNEPVCLQPNWFHIYNSISIF